jgi:hypothetical protein
MAIASPAGYCTNSTEELADTRHGREEASLPIAVIIEAHYDADADAVFASALRFSEMAEAMSGLAVYAGLPADGTTREGDTICVDVTFWGWFRQKGHRMFIERLDPAARVIQSRETGNGIRRWDHNLSVQPDGAGSCWTDTVVIDAGWRTSVVARFARFVYLRRHRYRKAMSISHRMEAA